MAAASGLMLVAPEKRNPLLASSFGTGELIRHALDNGIRHIILGIGGSATVDGGMGMAQALGVRFLDADGQVLAANGGNLARVASIEMDECDPRLANCHIEVACDVDNPLVGPRGAAAVFGPQKRGNAGNGRRAGTGAAKFRPRFTTANGNQRLPDGGRRRGGRDGYCGGGIPQCGY
ncbi:glycerate kinase II [Escherichia coli]|uniref:Glycerate kinase II n=1 Tax=Escherichia coli TaxID=562 RepID=A0A376K638_ECOLX|nr:glycerate kinase II [Escherichia coli]